jgi:general L-amino acid transport system substrate-binding protein
MKLKHTVMAAAALAVGATASAQAQDKSTLQVVQDRGYMNCQVGQPNPGFYNLDATGNWSGHDVAFCRAVAAAVLGDHTKIEFQSVTSQVRFTSLANGESDMLSRTTTWTATRDTQLGLDFTTVTMYDGQGFLVSNESGIKSAKELDGAAVCVLTGTTTELNLSDYFRSQGMNFKPVTFEDVNVLIETFLKGGCDVYTNDKSGLASRRSAFPDPSKYTILPETISKEPLGPVVREGDNQWGDIVRWSVFAMITAEELGVNSGNVDDMRANSKNPEIRRMLGAEGNLHTGLGLSNDWAYNIIKMVGNYGEVYARYLGEKTPVNIPRAGSQNALWTNGGLIYSPPFR